MLKNKFILGHTRKSAYCSSFKCESPSLQVAKREEGASVWLTVEIQQTSFQPVSINHLTFNTCDKDRPVFMYFYCNYITSKCDARICINLPYSQRREV